MALAATAGGASSKPEVVLVQAPPEVVPPVPPVRQGDQGPSGPLLTPGIRPHKNDKGPELPPELKPDPAPDKKAEPMFWSTEYPSPWFLPTHSGIKEFLRMRFKNSKCYRAIFHQSLANLATAS